MRRLVASLAGLGVLLGVAVLLPAAWVSTHVTSEDGWVDFSRPWATDERLEVAAAQAATSGLVPDQLPASVQQLARQAITRATSEVVQGRRWVPAWEESQRLSHRLTLDGDGRVVVDLAPLAQAAVDDATGDLPVQIPVPDRVLVRGQAEPRPEVIERIESAPAWTERSAALVVVALAVLLLAARRRARALAVTAVGVAVVAGALAAATWVFSGATPSGGTEFSRTFTAVVVDDAAASFLGWTGWTAAGALVLAGVSGAIGLVAGRRPR